MSPQLFARRVMITSAASESRHTYAAGWTANRALLPEEYAQPCDGGACGHLLFTDPEGEFFVISVVFPSGTSSGVHYHGAWGVIGILQGTDEETKYA